MSCFRNIDGEIYDASVDGVLQGRISTNEVLEGRISTLFTVSGEVSPSSSPGVGVLSVRIGSVTDNYPLSIVNSGTERNVVLDFVIPASIDHLGQIEPVIFYCGSATEVI